MKNIWKPLVLLVVMAVAAGAWWWSLTDSKRRFFYHMGKQVPYMPFGHFALPRAQPPARRGMMETTSPDLSFVFIPLSISAFLPLTVTMHPSR